MLHTALRPSEPGAIEVKYRAEHGVIEFGGCDETIRSRIDVEASVRRRARRRLARAELADVSTGRNPSGWMADPDAPGPNTRSSGSNRSRAWCWGLQLSSVAIFAADGLSRYDSMNRFWGTRRNHFFVCLLNARADTNPLIARIQHGLQLDRTTSSKQRRRCRPDSLDFKPTPEIRSFGALTCGHIADSQLRTCSTVKGRPSKRPRTARRPRPTW